MKKIYKLFMMFLLLFIGQNAWGQDATEVASGDLNSDIHWSVSSTDSNQTYTLTITGSGDMPDYTSSGTPWGKAIGGASENSKINVVNIDSRITKIGDYSFMGVNITSVDIPTSCTSIGTRAFFYCSNLKEIYIPSSVTSLNSHAFDGCGNLSLIHYDGRCTENTKLYIYDLPATGKIIEKEGTGNTCFLVPSGWEYYTHGVRCNGGAWVAENADQTKLFFYAQNPGATVNYAGRKASGTSTNDERYHPWRVNCMNYTSLEINKNIASIAASELIGYETNGLMYGYAKIENITVESDNENFVVGDEGALYDKAKTTVYLYPAKSTATDIEIPSTVTQVRAGAFLGAMNLKSISFLGTVKNIRAYAFAYARSLNKIYFASQTAPTTYYDTSFIGVPSTGVVFAGADTEAFQTLTTTIGSNWTLDGETYGPIKSYISDGTLYVVGKGEYTTSSSNADWYSQRSSIKKIVVKEGITDIGGSAFANCSNVTEATLNNNGKIGYSAFKDCSALTRVNIGGGVNNFDYSYRAQDAWHYTETVDAFPFEGCSKLATINVTDLASYCPISNLKYLTDREFGTASVKTLMVNGTTHSSTSELVIPENVSSISPYAFRYFSNVTKIKLPSKMTEIASSNFYGHTYLTEITVPSTVSSVGSSAFSGCTSLKTATLNNNGDIGYSAFSGCTALQTVTLNNNGYVDYYAFKDCSALIRINIGSGVSAFKSYSYLNSDFLTVHCYPFSGCSKLASVNTTDLKAFCSIGNLEYLTNSEYGTDTDKILLINGLIHSYTSALVIPDDVTSISSYAFRYFSNVTKIKLPSKMTEIASSNFYGHTYLTEITVPSTVSSVGSSAFSGCTSLKTATLNNNGDIGYSAFSGCTALQTVTLNNNGYVDYYAFKDCSALIRINIGSGVSAFKSYSYLNSDFLTVHCYPFSGCSKLASVNTTDLKAFCSIGNLEYLTKSECGTAADKTLMVNGTAHSSTSELVIPDDVTSISSYAFRYFSNVTKIKLPSKMTEIASSNFYGHTYLTEITVPSTVSSVGSSAFSGCTSLKTATLNNNGDIGYSAFSGCTALQTVSLNNNGYVDYYAFKDCSALTRINIGSGVSAFKSYSYLNSDILTVHCYPFSGCSKLATINVTDLVSFNDISSLKYLTDGEYGTAEKKTLMINGEGVWGDEILYLPEEITSYNNSALRYFSNVQRISLPSTMTTVSGFNDHSYLTHVTLSSKVESVTKNAFANCSNLERIVCLAPTCPSTTGSIATEPSTITLKVPYGTASLYKAADVWKEFNVEGGKQYVYDINIDVLQSVKLSNLHNILTTEKALSWNSSNTAVATVNDGVVTGTNFVYDGSTLQPAKYVKITAELEEGDYYFCGVHVTPKEVALTDGNAYKLTEDYEAKKVSYTRTYAEKYKNHLQCFYVPFDVEVTDELLEGYTFYELYMVSQKDVNANGEIEDDEPLVMVLSKIPAGDVIQANMPYYIKPKGATTLTVTAENATLHAAAQGIVSCSTTKYEYTLTGIYETTNIKGHYTMAANGTFKHFSGDTNLGSYRWYMTARNRRAEGAEYENYARPVEIVIDGEDDVTGIVTLQDKSSASKNDKIYTLDGRQVTDYDNLPSGIYIINGKKVFKK